MTRSGRGTVGVVAVALTVLAQAGCAAKVNPYTEPEQARIDEYERAAAQILRSRGIEGSPPAVRIGDDAALAGAARPAGHFVPRTGLSDLGRPGHIVVNRQAIADDLIAQAVLSRELARYVLGHADGRCRDRRQECEVEASITSVELLMTGWELSYGEAVRLQYAYLKSVVLAAQRGDPPASPGAGDSCSELQEFAARFKASATCD